VTHHPKKRLGQNFLVDPSIARRIVGSLDRSATGPIVEIGPGRGIPTTLLAGLFRPLYAVEKDADLLPPLQETFGGRGDIHILQGDILAFDFRELHENHGRRKLSLIGNIPFKITSPLLDRISIQRELFDECVLMIQKEVADRLLSPPGSRVYGGLSVIVNYFARVERCLNVKKGSFFPVPDVDASVIRMSMDRPDHPKVSDEAYFVEVVRTFFSWRRKQIGTTLKRHPGFLLDRDELDTLDRGLDYPLTRRPEELSVADFVLLSDRLLLVRGSRDFPQPDSK